MTFSLFPYKSGVRGVVKTCVISLQTRRREYWCRS